jgi:hypothetical protein
LSAEDVKAVVRSPSERTVLKTGRNGGKVTRLKKTAGNKTLVVIAEIRHEECWIMTAYYEC